MTPSPLLTINATILWLKVVLTAATLVLLYRRYKRGSASRASSPAYSLGTRMAIALAILFSFGVFHNLGTFRGGSFIHYGEMFHYYLGSKYFNEVGYYDLYNAVIVADTEQGNALAGLPFYTDLHTYQNAPREAALADIDRIKKLFTHERWDAFKGDVAFFKQATGTPSSPGLIFLLMDHGYNASPISTLVLGTLTNLVPVTHLPLLASIDVVLVAAMIALVFHTFGFEMGALFSIYFFVNILNNREYISGSILRYDWLLYIIAAACLLEKRRYASSAVFLTLAAMMRVFPAVLFYGVAVAMFQQTKATRSVDRKHVRFVLAAGITGIALFLLPAVSLGSIVQPWKDFSANTELHDRGVYVNHLGFRGMVLFEPSHLSLDRFVAAYKSAQTDDIVRHWQDVKENEFRRKRPIVVFASLFVLVCLTVIIWKRRATEAESILWPSLLIYTMSYPSHYYYSFLCLLVLLFFRRASSLGAFVPIAILLTLNIGALVTDYFGPSPIVFYTLVNIYLFIALSSILGFELYWAFSKPQVETVASSDPAAASSRSSFKPRRDAKQRRRRRPNRAHGK